MLDRSELHRLAAALGGLPVLGCRPGSPAQQAGVRYGDILMSVNGVRTPDWQTFMAAREQCKTGMVVEVFRDGVHITFEVRLDDPAPPVDAPTLLAEILAEHVTPLALGSETGRNKHWN